MKVVTSKRVLVIAIKLARTILRFWYRLKGLSVRREARISKVKETESRCVETFTQAFAQEIRSGLYESRLVHVTLVRFELRLDFSSNSRELIFANCPANRVVQHPVDAAQRLLKFARVGPGGVFVFSAHFDE